MIRRLYLLLPAILIIPVWGCLCFAQTEPISPEIMQEKLPFELVVKVTDVFKKPLAGVRIEYQNLENKRHGAGLTNAKGEFRIAEFPGFYFIRAVREGFNPWTITQLLRKTSISSKINIILRPEGVSPNMPEPKPQVTRDQPMILGPGLDAIFEVTVTDNNKKSLAGIFVNYHNLEKINHNGGGVTNAEGIFRWAYYPGLYRLEVIGKGFKRWISKPVAFKSNETLKINVVLGSNTNASFRANLKPEDYLQQALNAVRSDMDARNENVDGLNLVPSGEPVLKPDISESRIKSPKAAETPDAIVLIHIFKNNSLKEQAKVAFVDQQPMISFSGQTSVFSKDAMNEAELRQAVEEMDSFFTTAVDIQLGSKRFYKFFPENIRSIFMHPDRKLRMFMPPGAVDESWREQLIKEIASRGARPRPLDDINSPARMLSDDELRQFAALTFDLTVQGVWFALEGLEGIEEGNLKSAQLASDPREFIKIL
jgi:hypothetical protein